MDIEASGFGANSYPIEIGVAISDGTRYCRLIKPFEHWTHWDSEAEALHGISREILAQHGVDPRQVCEDLNHLLKDRSVYSDGWVVDNPWLIKLYEACGMQPTFTFSALEMVLSEPQMVVWHAIKQDLTERWPQARHRASADADLIQNTWLVSRQQTNAQAAAAG
ncbi:hypothetical protein [Bowmanella sp. JS7-9]|uniref:Exonuclease domain-containing protein n=1 Tax=Pseudobowmanella zhangzhouensis TaxID=1537679 RepID=A0ABW1XRK9_9ALTE|nr:hypothetical protein [Bowmanella sp. JS7-9]